MPDRNGFCLKRSVGSVQFTFIWILYKKFVKLWSIINVINYMFKAMNKDMNVLDAFEVNWKGTIMSQIDVILLKLYEKCPNTVFFSGSFLY